MDKVDSAESSGRSASSLISSVEVTVDVVTVCQCMQGLPSDCSCGLELHGDIPLPRFGVLWLLAVLSLRSVSLVFQNNLACAFSVNVELIAARAYSGVVCFGDSFAVYSDMVCLFLVSFSFGSFCRCTVMLAATVILMRDTCGWTIQFSQVVLIARQLIQLCLAGAHMLTRSSICRFGQLCPQAQ